MLSTRQISVIAIMTAVCVSTNYVLVGIVNVKFMDLIVFVSGLVFGPLVGISIGTLSWLIYGTLNPYGFSLPILVATCMGESLYGLVGGLLNRMKFLQGHQEDARSLLLNSGKFAIIGFLLTFFYDVFTNIISSLALGIPLYLAMVAGVPFALVHEISNMLFFFVGVSPLISIIRRFPYESQVSSVVE